MNNMEDIYNNSLQNFYLPEYTALFRRIQNEVDAILNSLGFKECLFPKLIDVSDLKLLQRANSRFEIEWASELVETCDINLDGKKRRFALPHWQCEPFYFFLKKNPCQEFKFYDHSGWSYRKEKSYDGYRLFEFLRTEIVFCLRKSNSEQVYLSIVNALYDYLKNDCGIDVRIVEKDDEKQETSEKRIIDIEAFVDKRWIEVVGCHLHGDIFIKALEIAENDLYDTGCCGIGLSRITNILYQRGQL